MARAAGVDSVRDSRGVAVADFDGDGRLDLAIHSNAGPPTIYRNTHEQSGHWLSFLLTGSNSNRDAVGVRVALTFADASSRRRTLTRWVEAGSGYASQSAFPVHFGLGDSAVVEGLEITWPSGHVDRLPGDTLGIDRRVRIGEGRAFADDARRE